MLTFQLLGGISLTDSDGREVDALLRQPKHIALLAYLCMPKPGTWHRRDSVLGTFWPETDQSRARSALRTALYTLRSHLPDGVINSRGDDELNIAPEVIRTDVSAMAEDFEAGRYTDALKRYKGELLPGIYIADAPVFEKWLDGERRRVMEIARKSAVQRCIDLEIQGDLSGSIDSARQAYELDPDDEGAARRWIALLDRAGDRSQAFAVYERFRKHMSESFGVRPSAETVALLDVIRTRRVATSQVTDPVVTKPTESAPGRTRFKWALPVAVVVVVAVALVLLLPARKTVTANEASRSLVVLPMENETGDPALDYVAAGIAEGIARRLDGLGGLRIHSGARSDWSDSVRHDVRLIGKELGSRLLLRTALTQRNDSLEVTATIVDIEKSGTSDISGRRFMTDGIRDVESRLAADIAGTVFRKGQPQVPRALDQPVDPESYKLMLKGWHTMLANPNLATSSGPPREYTARDQFSKAVAIDPLNARAWSGLSSAWASLTVAGQIPFEDGFDKTAAAALHALAIDSLQGSAWANLAATRALKYSNLSVGLDLIRKAERAEPSNPEIFLIKATLFRAAHRYDEARDAIRVARTLDPLSLVYLSHEAVIEFCADRPDAALRIFEAERRANPDAPVAVSGMIRSLALLGRFDEALALWKARAAASGDTSLARALSKVHGSKGYWDMKHREGRRRLVAAKGTNTPLQMITTQFAAGDPEAAYRLIERISPREKPTLYRLSCTPGADEYRRTPRFKAALARIGRLQ